MSASVFARAGLVLALAAATSAHATNGYFSHGYGIKAKGAAGVAAALPQDALVIATNPAGLLSLGSRLDVGAELFIPDRSASIKGNMAGPDQTFDGNGTEYFLIPEFGYNRRLGDDAAVGLAVYGNGGMNTDYVQNPYARFGGTGKVYMNLEQLFIAPALAWKTGERSSAGIALNFAVQQFEMQGAGVFAPFSADAAHLSDNGPDTSTGMGLRLGWQGEIADGVTLGASWQTKTAMSPFNKYAGLFANAGDFDIPENWVLGVAWRASDRLTLALDWQGIQYSDVPAVGNTSTTLFTGSPLGSVGGPGFGWRDIRVLKLAAVYALDEKLTLRAGVSHSDQPIPAGETFINIIAPGVVEDHLTLGATWAVGEQDELSVHYARAFENTVNGNGSIPAGFGGGEASGTLAEDMVGIAWSRKY